MTHTRSMEIPDFLSIERDDVSQQRTGQGNIGIMRQTALPCRQEVLTNPIHPATIEPPVILVPRILPAAIKATRPRAHGLKDRCLRATRNGKHRDAERL